MDETLREKIRTLADKHGLDPAELEAVFLSGDIPPELVQAMEAVMGDVSMFAQALKNLDT